MDLGNLTTWVGKKFVAAGCARLLARSSRRPVHQGCWCSSGLFCVLTMEDAAGDQAAGRASSAGASCRADCGFALRHPAQWGRSDRVVGAARRLVPRGVFTAAPGEVRQRSRATRASGFPAPRQVQVGGGSLKPGDLGHESLGLRLKGREGGGKGSIAFRDSREEAVVGRQLSRGLPDALRGVQLGRVGGKPTELHFPRVVVQPLFPRVIQPMARAVVDDEEDLAGTELPDQLDQVLVEGVPVEDRGKLEAEPAVPQGNGAKDVGGLSQSKGGDPGLFADG